MCVYINILRILWLYDACRTLRAKLFYYFLIFILGLLKTNNFTRYCTFFVYFQSSPFFSQAPAPAPRSCFYKFLLPPSKKAWLPAPRVFLPALASSKKARILGAVFINFLLLAPASFKKVRQSNTDINKTFCAIFA